MYFSLLSTLLSTYMNKWTCITWRTLCFSKQATYFRTLWSSPGLWRPPSLRSVSSLSSSSWQSSLWWSPKLCDLPVLTQADPQLMCWPGLWCWEYLSEAACYRLRPGWSAANCLTATNRLSPWSGLEQHNRCLGVNFAAYSTGFQPDVKSCGEPLVMIEFDGPNKELI